MDACESPRLVFLKLSVTDTQLNLIVHGRVWGILLDTCGSSTLARSLTARHWEFSRLSISPILNRASKHSLRWGSEMADIVLHAFPDIKDYITRTKSTPNIYVTRSI